MTLFAYLLVATCAACWAWVEHCERKETRAWWGQWHQARSWRVVPDLFDWQEHGL